MSLDINMDNEELVRSTCPEVHCTYHAPHGDSAGGYRVHVWGRQIAGTKLHETREAAFAAALKVIQGGSDEPTAS